MNEIGDIRSSWTSCRDILEGIRDGILSVPFYLPVALMFAAIAGTDGAMLDIRRKA